MKKPEIPFNESDRLSILYSLNILNTPKEERFDRIIRIARRIFNVPIALISLVSEQNQWFKSCFGLSAKETSRDVSFCGHAILSKEVLIVEDATKDERFFDNPLVTEQPFISFYAGCPLVVNHHLMGTLCIIDHKPRKLHPEDLDMIRDLAGMVEQEISSIQLAITDELTKISNRRGLFIFAEYALDFCKQKLLPAYIILFDLDKFKEINDNFGHAEGDRTLSIFANELTNNFDNSDVLARLGGDEFVVFTTNTTQDAIDGLLNRFRQSLDQRYLELNLPYKIHYSVGIAKFDPIKHKDIDELLHDADESMYSAKKLSKL